MFHKPKRVFFNPFRILFAIDIIDLRTYKYAAERLTTAGCVVYEPEFDCIDLEYGKVILKTGNEQVKAFISPYSLSCKIESAFEVASTVKELEEKDLTGKIAVLHGELCKEQIAPKNFVFFNPEEHQQIVKLLEEKKPLAIAAITDKNPELAGALYPFNLFEDGDFDIPSVYLTEEEGKKILDHPGSKMYLLIESKRIPSKGANVIGIKKKDRIQKES